MYLCQAAYRTDTAERGNKKDRFPSGNLSYCQFMRLFSEVMLVKEL